MPLPVENIPWPPEDHQAAYHAFAEWAAWYSGDPVGLANTYGSIPDVERPRRWMFWTRKGENPSGEQRRTKLHVPVASDIAQLSADLLFSETPSITSEQDGEELEALLEATQFHNKVLEGAEIAAAMGGVYLRPTWDREVSKNPILTLVHPDQAAPEWRHGVLRAVTFWRVLSDDEDQKVIRWLERHEPGVIYHGLYQGTTEKIGDPLPDDAFDAYNATAGLTPEIQTDFDGLGVRYVPNMRPARRLRKSDHGRSDFDGSEGLMDALDETYTSWMRDIRLGKSRLLASSDMLERIGVGRGAAFDVDQEVFTPLEMPPDSEGSKLVQEVQFKIRFEEHSKTALDILERIVSGAGYSPQSFGIGIEGRAEAGIALRVRERRSLMTQAKKQRYWKPAILDVVAMMSQIASSKLGNSDLAPDPNALMLEWADSVAPDIRETAETIELLARAEAASTETMVMMQHPDWTETEVAEEVVRIQKSKPAPMPNPFDPGTDSVPEEEEPPEVDDE